MSASKYDKQPGADAKQTRDDTDPTVKAQSSPEGIHIADLPERYEDGRMVLLARDPTWLYAYWDLTAEQHRQVWTGSRVVLRVIELKEGHFLREVKRIPLTRGARSWYFQIDDPGCVYQVALGFIDAQECFCCVLASNPSTMPPSAMADTEEFVFATYQPGQTP